MASITTVPVDYSKVEASTTVPDDSKVEASITTVVPDDYSKVEASTTVLDDSKVEASTTTVPDDPPKVEESMNDLVGQLTFATAETKAPTKYRFILAPGNGGCGRNIKAANWYAWFDREITKRGHESICVNWPDPNICHQSKWIPYCLNDLKADNKTVIVGHSTGALMAMKLIETSRVFGVILVAAAHTDLGDAGERASGYFDSPWNWNSMLSNVEFIHQFHSSDDPLIPVAEARYVAEQLKNPIHTYDELTGFSHFFEPFQALLDAVDRYCPPVV